MMIPDPNYQPILYGIILLFTAIAIIGFLVQIAYGDDHMDAHQLILAQLKMEEGFRGTPYKDQNGNWTVGYGRNLSGRGFTRTEHEHVMPDLRYPATLAQYLAYLRSKPLSESLASYLLESDLKVVEGDATSVYGGLWNKLPTAKKVAIGDMLFNLGLYRYEKFRRHIAAVKQQDWAEAAKQVENSLAYQQDRNRYKRIAKQLRGEK